MISAEKEQVPFLRPIDVNEGEKKGNVEIWLSEIESVMIRTLRKVTEDSLKDATKRTQWIRKWPGQVILAVNMVRWTVRAEAAIREQTIAPFLDSLKADISDLV